MYCSSFRRLFAFIFLLFVGCVQFTYILVQNFILKIFTFTYEIVANLFTNFWKKFTRVRLVQVHTLGVFRPLPRNPLSPMRSKIVAVVCLVLAFVPFFFWRFEQVWKVTGGEGYTFTQKIDNKVQVCSMPPSTLLTHLFLFVISMGLRKCDGNDRFYNEFNGFKKGKIKRTLLFLRANALKMIRSLELYFTCIWCHICDLFSILFSQKWNVKFW